MLHRGIACINLLKTAIKEHFEVLRLPTKNTRGMVMLLKKNL